MVDIYITNLYKDKIAHYVVPRGKFYMNEYFLISGNISGMVVVDYPKELNETSLASLRRHDDENKLCLPISLASNVIFKGDPRISNKVSSIRVKVIRRGNLYQSGYIVATMIELSQI